MELDPSHLFPVHKTDMYLAPQARAIVRDPARVPLIDMPYFDTGFEKSSMLHGRTMEDPQQFIFTGEPLFDENGDNYPALTIKGADANFTRLSHYPIEPNEVRINGMLDASVFQRCRAVSRHLRRAGVLTEWPFYTARPRRFPLHPRDETTHLDFKEFIYEGYVRDVKLHRNPNYRDPSDSLGVVGLVGANLLDLDFGVMYRGMMSNIRVAELAVLTPEAKEEHVAKAIRALQVREPKHFSTWNDIKDLDAEDQFDQSRYIQLILPRLIAENLLRFHETGAYHKYPHNGNWTIAGEIVDLDSVRAKWFDDDSNEVTMKNQIQEFLYVGEYLINSPLIFEPRSDLSRVMLVSTFMDGYISFENSKTNTSSGLRQAIVESLDGLAKDDSKKAAARRDPYIVRLSDAEMTEGLEQAASFNEAHLQANPEMPILRRLANFFSIYFYPEVQRQVTDALRNNGFDDVPYWLKPELIVANESARLHNLLVQRFNEQILLRFSCTANELSEAVEV